MRELPTDTADTSVEAFLAELAARDVHLSVDGEKLKVNAPAGALDAALKTALASRKAELVAALRAAPAVAPGGRSELRRVPRVAPLPLSFAQQRLWFFDRLQPGSPHYNIVLAMRLSGTVDRGALTTALDALVQRHESLRMRFREVDGSPWAEVVPEVGSVVEFVDLAALPETEREAEVRRRVVEHGLLPFDLTRGPLASFLLLRRTPDEHVLVSRMHHIASDGWSLGVAARELCVLYEAAVAGLPSPLPPLTIDYVDYAAWQREQMRSGRLAQQLAYWKGELADAPALLDLPTDHPRPAVQTFRGARASHRMPAALLDALKGFSRAQDVTLYMTLLAGWQALLARFSGQDDVVVGSPMANRDRPEFDGLIGCFVNNVVMRGRLEGNPRFRDYLQQVKATVLRAFDSRELPFDRLVEALRPQRTTSHSPIFQVLFTLHSFPQERMRPSGLEVEPIDSADFGLDMARFDLSLEMDETEGELRMMYEYATDLFAPPTIDRLHAHFVTLLRNVVADADQRVHDVALTTPEEEAALWGRVNDTAREHDRTACVHDLVRAAAERTPDAVAVEASDETLTYAALERRANQLAHALRARGVGAGALVGVCLDRTAALPVALLGVLRAGAAYVPVDPSHPADRLAYTLRDAQVSCVVTESRFAALVADAEAPLLLVDADATLGEQPTGAPSGGAGPDDLAYVIYTSGSTGRPKGVEIEHRSVVNFLRSMQQEPGIGPDSVLLAVTTPSFDIAGLEIFLPLITGARTVIADRAAVLDGERLARLAATCGATILQATPATWRVLVDAGWAGAPSLTALCGGEALPRDLARALLGRVGALWNMYGPTETTIWSTVERVREADATIPIGRPIANTTVYVLDAAGRPAPIGVPGELCIGGEGLARGYRGRPELTAEKFVTLALEGRAPERVYRTGDVVRLRGDLSLEYVGRRDHQVKVRGYRIELGEIESVLAEHPEVRRSTVIVREDVPGDRRLAAYVVPVSGDSLDAESIRTLLRSRLPEYMVPSAIVPLPELPLTPNGKVDRKALPVPPAGGASAPGAAADVVMTDGQRRVAAVWQEVLRAERVGLHENFFDIGGHSLLVVKVHAALQREFGRELTVVDLFQRTTVAAQAELVSATADGDAALRRAQARIARQAVA